MLVEKSTTALLAKNKRVKYTPELKASIASEGIIVSITITPRGKVLDGRKRLSAAYDLGLSRVPCSVITQRSP